MGARALGLGLLVLLELLGLVLGLVLGLGLLGLGLLGLGLLVLLQGLGWRLSARQRRSPAAGGGYPRRGLALALALALTLALAPVLTLALTLPLALTVP